MWEQMIHTENIYLHKEFKDAVFIILSGPSAGGKTYLSKQFYNVIDNTVLLIKHTDRLIRPGEIENEDYYFLSTIEFQNLLTPKTAMAVIKRYNHLYGLSCKEIIRAKEKNSIPLFILDPNAAIAFKTVYQNSIICFVGPSNLDIIQQRLFERGDNPKEIEKRLELLDEEYSLRNQFDILIDNNYTLQSLKKLFINKIKGKFKL